MNKVKWREGLYRIFVLLSFVTSLVCLIFYKSFFDLDYLWQGILISIFSGISVYILYFLLDWVISGFIQDKSNNDGLKSFVKVILNKINSANYRIPFYFLLIILLPLTLVDVSNSYKKYVYENFKYENEMLYKKNLDIQKQLEQCTYNLAKIQNADIHNEDINEDEIKKMDKTIGLP